MGWLRLGGAADGGHNFLGEDLHLRLDIGGGATLRAAMKNAGAARGWAAAQPVDIAVDPADLRLLRR